MNAILIAAALKTRQRKAADPAVALDELCRLAETGDVEVLEKVLIRVPRYSPSTLICSGKVEELKRRVMETKPGLVIFDDELAPAIGSPDLLTVADSAVKSGAKSPGGNGGAHSSYSNDESVSREADFAWGRCPAKLCCGAIFGHRVVDRIASVPSIFVTGVVDHACPLRPPLLNRP